MPEFKLTSKIAKMIAMGAIGLITYNIILFAICGFSNHGAAFWLSYVFMLMPFGTLTLSGWLLKNRDFQPKDWLLGYPILKHCWIYFALEFVASTLFIIFDYKGCPWALAFAVQVLLLAVHLVMIISCFLAKEMIEEAQTNVKNHTSFLKLLQVDIETVAENTNDVSTKEAFHKLAEKVRYSDPMSNDMLVDIEQQIKQQVSNANSCILMNDKEGALQCCRMAETLLLERNKKCKVFK